MQQRFALLGLLAEFAHVVEELFDVLLLLGHLTGLRLILQTLRDVAIGAARLTGEQALDLYTSSPLFELGRWADARCRSP